MNSLSIPPPFPTSMADGGDIAEQEEHERSLSKKNIANHQVAETGDDTVSSMSDDNTSSIDSGNIQENLASALQLKSEGTEKLKNNEFEAARDIYKTALSKLKTDNESKETEEFQQQLKETRISIKSNLTLCYVRLENWIEAIHTASDVLKLDQKNIKALYRRGLARTNVGLLEEARTDLLGAYDLDRNNTEIRRELQNVKQLLIQARANDKKSYSNLFAKAEGLYDDQERLIAKQKKLEEGALQNEMKEFEEENRRRESQKQKVFSSFEEWKASKKETKPSQQQQQQASSSQPTTSTSKKPTTVSDTLDLDEEDHKIIMETKKMGYCYFNRPKQDEDMDLAKPVPSMLNTAVEQDQRSTKSLSSWNAGGTTYEELDCSTWCSNTFKSWMLKCIIQTQSFHIEVKSIKECAAEAQVVVIRSSKRYLYDISCQLTWNLTILQEEPVNITGELYLTDVSSTTSSTPSKDLHNQTQTSIPDWLQQAKIKIDSSYDKTKFENTVQESLSQLKQDIYEKVQLFEEEYKAYA